MGSFRGALVLLLVLLEVAVAFMPTGVAPVPNRELQKLHVDADLTSPALTAPSDKFTEFAAFIRKAQAEICSQAEQLDGKATFCEDKWFREPVTRGEGITRVLEGGNVFEKAACSISIVHGVLNSHRAQSMSSRGRDGINPEGGQSFSAAAISLVFHSANPLVPTLRADTRYFEVEGGNGWYGGGADLTPFYLNEEDIRGFHAHYKKICDKYDVTAYPKFKKWTDEYFYIPCRKEHRGVGGIFFDDLEDIGGHEPLAFVQDVTSSFMPSYLPFAGKRTKEPFTEEQRQWQLLRRGRYLEFNLMYDRGVKFGLHGADNSAMERIMVSAPPMIAWRYTPERMSKLGDGSEESKLLEVLKTPREWV